MILAIGTTFMNPIVGSYGWIITGIIVGGVIGTIIAQKIQMTSLPQLVAAFHSLVGLSAVAVAAAALNEPQAFGIGMPGDIHGSSLIEMGLGVVIGAITFSGSVIAFLKLNGNMSGKPILLPASVGLYVDPAPIASDGFFNVASLSDWSCPLEARAFTPDDA